MRILWSRLALFALLTSFLTLSLLSTLVAVGPHLVPADKPGKPRLAVLLVFDQLRGDYLSRWYDLYPEGGFRRLTGEGAWFVDCHYPYANTMTGPGHATLAAGCTPQTHGIVANDWFDLKHDRSMYCVASDRYAQVPPAAANPKARKPASGVAPENLLAPTLADAIKAQLGKQSRVVSLSLKDRSAVLPAGKTPDACYWCSTSTGQFVTSTFYRDRVHPWVKDFNASGFVDRWQGKNWDRFRPLVDYARHADIDDRVGEGSGNGQKRTFPHPFGGERAPRSTYLGAVANSPFGNEVLWELAQAAITAEKLGSHETPDFLSISFSSNDLVGHTYGPDSQEVLDTTLRSDALVKNILATLDNKVGKGNYVVVLSADHGICPLPEVSRSRGVNAQRLDFAPLLASAEAYLDKKFPPQQAAQADRKRWIRAATSGMFYLDRQKLDRRQVKREDAEVALAGWLATQRGIAAAYTRGQMLSDKPLDAVGQKVRNSFYPTRSGDVMIVLRPYWLPSSNSKSELTGTTHGTPHDYDTHVPLVVFGPGVKPGKRKDKVSPEAAAVILAGALGIKPPAGAAVSLPRGLLAGK